MLSYSNSLLHKINCYTSQHHYNYKATVFQNMQKIIITVLVTLRCIPAKTTDKQLPTAQYTE